MGCAFCVLCVVVYCYVLCWCWCWCAMCGAWCVCRGCVCGVLCAVCVARLGTRKNPVCRFKTSPCVGSKRIRVCRQNARMLNTCARFAGTHGGVLNLHTEGFSLSSPSLFLSFLSFSLSLPSYFSRSLSLLSSLLSSLSATMTMITRPVGSLCVHTALTCECVGVRVLWLIPCLAELVRIKKKLCKPGATWNEVALHLCWKWVMCLVCLVVFGCVSMC